MYADLPGIRLAGVCDIDPVRAGAIGLRYGASAFTDVDEMLAELADAGHGLVVPVWGLLAKFSGLVIATEDGRRVVRIEGHEAARRANPDWCAAYAEGIDKAVTPIGEYSHMTLVIDESGAFWGGFDAEYGFMAIDVVDVVHALLVDLGSRRLDREVGV